MDKKLKKYIESYDLLENCTSYELIPNGGMIVLINQENNGEIFINNNSYELESFQAVLINAYEESVLIKSNEPLNLTAVRFRGAGASFFYEQYLDQLMQSSNEPIFLEKGIKVDELDTYFQNHFSPSKLPFNIMKIIDLLESQGSSFNIDEVLAIANVPRKILDKMFRLRAGLTFKTYAILREFDN